MTASGDSLSFNYLWEQKLITGGADFVRFVDASVLPEQAVAGYSCVILFGKALSKKYIADIRDGKAPEHKEAINTERKMDNLALKIACALEAEGYPSLGKQKTGVLPHKTVALRAGLGFIGKNNLLVTRDYGCALMLGTVLTRAPFDTYAVMPPSPECGSCTACVDICEPKALHGKQWSLGTPREAIIERRQCTLCLKCMVTCPYTQAYLDRDGR